MAQRMGQARIALKIDDKETEQNMALNEKEFIECLQANKTNRIAPTWAWEVRPRTKLLMLRL